MSAFARILLLTAGALAAAVVPTGTARADDPPPASPPNAQIVSGPQAATRTAQATFRFVGDEGTTSFTCTVDGATTGCASPFSTTVGDGDHVFSVRASGDAGTGPDASRSWTVRTQAPSAPQVTPPVPAYTNSADLVLAFSQQDGVAYQCRLDIGAFAACTSPTTFFGLADGWHTFAIRGVDAVGAGPSTLGSTMVDTVKPVVTARPPDDVETNPTPAVTLSASETVTYECSLDGATAVACSSPWRPGPLAPGPHTISVVGTDRAGNRSAAVSAGWTLSGPAGSPTPTATPTPTPTTSPGAGAAPGAVPAARPTAAPSAQPATAVVSPERPVPVVPPLALSSAPVVRIAGTVRARSTTVRLLSVRAPRTATVLVGCRGRSCPRRSGSINARGQRPVRVRWLDHARLRPGTVLSISILQDGRIGRFTQFVVRRNHAPTRSDRCLTPGRTAPVRCTGA